MVTGYINSDVKKEVKKPAQFTMLKNVEGALVVNLEAHDFSTPPRRIHFRFNEERKYIPVKWALGTFVTDKAMRQMELGLFTFDNLQQLIEMAEEAGYYVPDSIKEPKVAIKDIRKALKANDLTALEGFMRNMTTKVRDDIVDAARSLFNRLNNDTITLLEKELRTTLNPIDLDA